MMMMMMILFSPLDVSSLFRFLFLNSKYTRDQLNKNSIVFDRSIKNDRLYQIERERTDLQRSLIQTSSHFDQLSSEKHGLSIALDELRRRIFEIWLILSEWISFL